MANRYSVLLEFLENFNSHSIFEFEGKIKIIAVTYLYGVGLLLKISSRSV
jgi:hypothetical protein